MKIKLKNGLRIVGEKMPQMRSVAVGVWVGVGSRAETAENNGISHFIEHMLFKGTKRRTAKQIACEMDDIGGNLNAFTTREYTCYYAKAVDTDVEKVFDILSDMYLHSLLREQETELERGVILEEISMYEDTPEDVVQDLLQQTVWGSDPLGYGIAGSRETVSRITSAQLGQFMAKYYNAGNTVLAVAGSFQASQIRELAEKYFGAIPAGSSYTEYADVLFCDGHAEKKKEIEQVHIALGYPGVPMHGEERFAMSAFCNAFGGGMSSRLFQKIREDKGLAYSVFASPESFKNAGMLNIYAGTSPENADTVLRMILEEADDIVQNGMTEVELARSLSQLRSSFIMGQDSVSARMQAIGRSMLLLNEVQTFDEVLHGINSVTRTQVNALAQKILTAKRAEAFVSPKD